MMHVVLVLLSFALLVGFLVLTQYEMSRGVRFFAQRREQLDVRVRHIEFIVQHVDLAGFLRSEVQHVATRVGHDAVHLSLQLVRVVERLLTRTVRYLRSRHMRAEAPRESAREFVKTLSAFKDDLKGKHPDIEV